MRDVIFTVRKCACALCVAGLIAIPDVTNAQQLADNPLTVEVHAAVSSTAAYTTMRAVVFGDAFTITEHISAPLKSGETSVAGPLRQLLRDGAGRKVKLTIAGSGQSWPTAKQSSHLQRRFTGESR